MSEFNLTPVNIVADFTPWIKAGAKIAIDLHKGVGKMLHARFGHWIAERERQIKLTEAQNERDSQDILSGDKRLENGRLVSTSVPTSNVELYAQMRDLDAICEAQRLEATMLAAANLIQQIPEEQISDEPIDQTFFNRWRQEAELIDDEELRQWWAHLLVEETKKPNSISSRTLDVVKNLSRREALLFAQLCRGVVKGDMLIINSGGHPVFGTHIDVITLQEAGLFAPQNSTREYHPYQNPNRNDQIEVTIYLSDYRLVSICNENKASIIVSVICLTSAGKQIMKTSQAKADLSDVIKIAEQIVKNNNDIHISIWPDSYICGTPPLWENKKAESGAKSS